MTAAFGPLVLLRPLWLLALLPVLVAALWMRQRRAAGPWSAVIDPELLPALRRMGLFLDGRRDPALLLPFLAAGLLACALSGPAMLRPGPVEYRALDPLILAIDMSPSVVADPKVLTDAKAAAVGLTAAAEGRPVGLMLYAADAWLAFAPTSDATSLDGLIGVLARDTVPIAGSRPDIALSMARDLFGGASQGSGSSGSGSTGIGGADLVMITDGGGTGARAVEEAARLASDGARVWVLRLTRNAQGAPPPQPEALEELARAGHGAALPADQLAELTRRITAARSLRLAAEDSGGQSFRDLGPWLLPLAALTLLPLFRRRR